MNTFHFLFLNKMLVIRAVIHKMHVRIANMEDGQETVSSKAIFITCAQKSLFYTYQAGSN